MQRQTDLAAETPVMLQAMERVLADPAFARSPVLSRLLTYLVDATAKSSHLKSYIIAVDALGKVASDDAETYARVTVARLRKALAAYYASSNDEVELVIDPGSYRVSLAFRARPDDDVAAPTPSRTRWYDLISGYRWAWGIFGLAALLFLSLLIRHLGRSTDRGTWVPSNLPTLAVTSSGGGDDPGGTDRPDLQSERQKLLGALGTYTGFRLIEGLKADFEVRIERSSKPGTDGVTVSLVETRSGRLAWFGNMATGSPDVLEPAASATAFEIASPGGGLNSYLRRNNHGTQTPLGCWLRFTQDVQLYNTIGDSDLVNCAGDWYAADPKSPVAALLFGWVQTDNSVLVLRESRRREQLHQALNVLAKAAILNPEMGILQIAMMRNYSFAGDREMVVKSATTAIAISQGNRLIEGTAASGMALWNEDEGTRVLSGFSPDSSRTMPWEQAGLCIAAMMRDDVAGARSYESNLEPFTEHQPFLLLLEAAVAARSGDTSKAELALGKLRSNTGMAIFGVDNLVGRLPMAPEVKARLRAWIATGSKARASVG